MEMRKERGMKGKCAGGKITSNHKVKKTRRERCHEMLTAILVLFHCSKE